MHVSALVVFKKLALDSLHGLIPLQKQMIQLQFTYVSDMILCAYYLSFRGYRELLEIWPKITETSERVSSARKLIHREINYEYQILADKTF